MAVEAELHRRDGAGNLVDWVLTADAQSATGVADPVIDAGTRAGVGAPADAESTTGNGTIIGLLKRARTLLFDIKTVLTNGSARVVVDSVTSPVAITDNGGTITVDGGVSINNTVSTTFAPGAEVAVNNLESGLAKEATLGSRASEATLATAKDSLASIDDKIPASGLATENTLSNAKAVLDTLQISADSLTGAMSDSNLYRLLNQAIPNGNEMRLDLGTTDLYLAHAADGANTAGTTWTVLRIYLSSGSPTRMRVRTAMAWDSRTVGWT